MEQHFSKERTLVIIKPDGVQRTLVGEIIGRMERVGLKLVAMKLMVPPADKTEQHYLLDSTWLQKVGEKAIAAYEKKGITPPTTDPKEAGQKVLNGLKTYFTAGPAVFMVWQGAHAVPVVRKIVGSTEPLSSDVGTIRGDFVLDSYQMADTDNRAVRNLIHASGSVEEADMEIPHWFAASELTDYKLVQESILYDVNMDGILE